MYASISRQRVGALAWKNADDDAASRDALCRCFVSRLLGILAGRLKKPLAHAVRRREAFRARAIFRIRHRFAQHAAGRWRRWFGDRNAKLTSSRGALPLKAHLEFTGLAGDVFIVWATRLHQAFAHLGLNGRAPLEVIALLGDEGHGRTLGNLYSGVMPRRRGCFGNLNDLIKARNAHAIDAVLLHSAVAIEAAVAVVAGELRRDRWVAVGGAVLPCVLEDSAKYLLALEGVDWASGIGLAFVNAALVGAASAELSDGAQTAVGDGDPKRSIHGWLGLALSPRRGAVSRWPFFVANNLAVDLDGVCFAARTNVSALAAVLFARGLIFVKACRSRYALAPSS